MILMGTLAPKRPAQQFGEILSRYALCGTQWSLKIGGALHTLFMIQC